MEIRWANRSLSIDIINSATSYLEDRMEAGKRLLPGEIKKTEEDFDLIANANKCYRRIYAVLGIEDQFSDIDPNSVHFLSPVAFDSIYPDALGTAVTDRYNGRILIKKGEEADIVFRFLHEACHFTAFMNFSLDEESKFVRLKQDGFSVDTNSDLIPRVNINLNEAITDLIANSVQTNNMDMFYGQGATLENTNPLGATYPEEIAIFQSIIEGISKHKNEEFYDVWLTFLKSYFTGDLSVLKDIEIVFGKGSVKKLSLLGLERVRKDIGEKEKDDIVDKIRQHFSGKE